MDVNFVPKLKELSDKYRAAVIESVQLLDGAVLVNCDKGNYCFFYDFNKDFSDVDAVTVPLFHWQQKRRYSELQGLIDRKTVVHTKISNTAKMDVIALLHRIPITIK